MDKVYNHRFTEEKIYHMWEKNGYFKPEINPNGKPYSIILPPPNANGDLHFGHAMFVIEDILIRFHRMKGNQTLWLPGTDHAGTETQFVFEKKLQKDGKSRFDFTRSELYALIDAYVQENRGGIENQLRKLGFSLDWSRSKFTLDPDIVDIVKKTFQSMYHDGLVYRDYRLVNYCTKDGTSFSDLEVAYEERTDPLYFIKYGPLVLATTRPETKFGDTAVAVNPRDSRYKQYIGKTMDIETVLGFSKISVIADDYVDPEFGTGIVKITPAHDFNDYEVAKRHHLPMKQVIGFDGRLNEHAGKFSGMVVKKAREAIVAEMQQRGLIDKIDTNYRHRIGLCYKCKTVLEPLPLEQWYVKVSPLIEKAQQAVDKKYVAFYPKNFMLQLQQWYQNLHDWNISRQNVWGIQIPVWYEIEKEDHFSVSFIDSSGQQHKGKLSKILQQFSWDEVLNGLQTVIASIDAKFVFEHEKKVGKRYLPETDTFDTWFSSGQWPFVTLKTAMPGDFEKFYPTSVMETGYDIMRAWVSRMLLLGVYIAQKDLAEKNLPLNVAVPFRNVVLHGLVNDPYGKKMSKSKGNVVNPLELVDLYGADAVRFALVYGTALGNDQSMSYPKLEAMRKFTNKLWNMARFIEMKKPQEYVWKFPQQFTMNDIKQSASNVSDQKHIDSLQLFAQKITKYVEHYNFNNAAEAIYEYTWHEFADQYIENVKQRITPDSYTVLLASYLILLRIIHPFMPFISEEIFQLLIHPVSPLIITAWPE